MQFLLLFLRSQVVELHWRSWQEHQRQMVYKPGFAPCSWEGLSWTVPGEKKGLNIWCGIFWLWFSAPGLAQIKCYLVKWCWIVPSVTVIWNVFIFSANVHFQILSDRRLTDTEGSFLFCRDICPLSIYGRKQNEITKHHKCGMIEKGLGKSIPSEKKWELKNRKSYLNYRAWVAFS